MIDIKQLYDIAKRDELSKSSDSLKEELAAYTEILKRLHYLKNDNLDLIKEIEQMLNTYSDFECRSAFKLGFKTATELIASALN